MTTECNGCTILNSYYKGFIGTTEDTSIRSADYCIACLIFLILKTGLWICKGIHCSPHKNEGTLIHGVVTSIYQSKCADSHSTKHWLNTGEDHHWEEDLSGQGGF